MITNKEIKSYNGNREKSIKIAHWNKGNSLLATKIPEILNIAEQHKHVIIGISEANFSNNHNVGLVQIPHYQLHLGPQGTNGCSRIAIYSHKDLIVEPCTQLNKTDFSSIWLECRLLRQKKISVVSCL